MPERVLAVSKDVSSVVRRSIGDITRITSTTRMLAINALIEAERAGDAGRGFAVVAQDVRRISDEINQIAALLSDDLSAKMGTLDALGRGLVQHVRGTRLTDLSLNMIDVIDRNLYERSCDVRWWATDSAVVQCTASPADRNATDYCARRLGVILDAYTVYLDIWVCDLKGNVLASGRSGKYPNVRRANVANETWFREALATRSGADFAVADIAANRALDNRLVATYAAAVRAGGEVNGKPIGVLGIFFDWQSQSQAVVDGVRLTPDERSRTRCLIVNSQYKVIASSDRQGVLQEIFPLKHNGNAQGNYTDAAGQLVGFSLTPGYETYKGLGWYGVTVQKPATAGIA